MPIEGPRQDSQSTVFRVSQRFGSAASEPSRRPGHPARRTGWPTRFIVVSDLFSLLKLAITARVPVRPAPRRHPRTQRAARRRGPPRSCWAGTPGRPCSLRRRPRGRCPERARAGGTDRCRTPSPADRSPTGREDQNRRGARLPGRRTCPSRWFTGRVTCPPRPRRVGVPGNREGRATWRPGASCRSGPPAAGRLPG